MTPIQIENSDLFDIEDQWNVDEGICEESVLETLRYIDESALEVVESINRNLVGACYVAKTNDDRFLLYWHERHPEMCSADEFWDGKAYTEAEEREWDELRKRMPKGSYYYQWLTRSQAFHIIIATWLPDEFLPEINELL
jgi:hypothetical protein